MLTLSVVIITKNEAADITECITAAKAVSNDIIVIDSGSIDNTVNIAKNAGAKVICTKWENFSTSRNIGASYAINDWILSIDADERITTALATSIKKINDPTSSIIYGFKRENYFVSKKIRFGDWGHDVVYRLYNKTNTQWQVVPVHETLITGRSTKKMLPGKVLHYPVKDMGEYIEKTTRYAVLSARKYIALKRKPRIVKKTGSPIFNFLACYFFRLGFLDGKEGFIIALYTGYYSWLKYYYHGILYENTNLKI